MLVTEATAKTARPEVGMNTEKESPKAPKKALGFAGKKMVTVGARAARIAALTKAGQFKRRPLVLALPPGKMMTLTPDMHSRVEIANEATYGIKKSYQRKPIMQEVNDLIWVLQQGGTFIDEIQLAKRTFPEADGTVSSKLWCLDGQQRFLAAREVGVSLAAVVREVASLEEEKAAFIILNSHKRPHAANIVKSWPGPTGTLINRVAEADGHPLCGRVSFNVGDKTIGAGIIVRGLCACLSDDPATTDLATLIYKVDYELERSALQRQRAEAFLILLGRVFPTGYAHVLPVIALGLVARERWSKSSVQPSPKIVSRLSRINWRKNVASWAISFLPMVEAKVKRVWV